MTTVQKDPPTERAAQDSSSKHALQRLLARADIRLNGDRPWDPQIHDDRLYSRVLSGGRLAAGGTYMDGWWDCEALNAFFFRALRANLHEEFRASPQMIWNVLKAKLFNLKSRSRAFQVGKHHYDRGNDLYEAMLGRHMTYSCGYWAHAETLSEAQEAKLDLLFQMLELEPGMHVLDVGCGWGSFLKYAAESYGVEGVGITVSEEQKSLAQQRCAEWPIEIRLQDYRELDDTFDRIVSVGMLEHVDPQLPHVHENHEGGPRPRRPSWTSVHRLLDEQPHGRPVDSQIHFSERRHSLGPADCPRYGGTMGHGNVAQYRPALRPHPDGLASKFRSPLG